jgi:hypothetical protein
LVLHIHLTMGDVNPDWFYLDGDGKLINAVEQRQRALVGHLTEPMPLPMAAGCYFVVCQELEDRTTVFEDFNLKTCRIVWHSYLTKWVREIHAGFVKDIHKPDPLVLATVEWGAPIESELILSDRRKVGVLIGPLDFRNDTVCQWWRGWFTKIGVQYINSYVVDRGPHIKSELMDVSVPAHEAK